MRNYSTSILSAEGWGRFLLFIYMTPIISSSSSSIELSITLLLVRSSLFLCIIFRKLYSKSNFKSAFVYPLFISAKLFSSSPSFIKQIKFGNLIKTLFIFRSRLSSFHIRLAVLTKVSMLHLLIKIFDGCL